MASSGPNTRVLAHAMEEAIGSSTVQTAVFVTFQFDPAFFEHNVLPSLFTRAFSNQENVRRTQLDEELRKLDNVDVYFDRKGLITEGGPPRLDYGRYGVSMQGGVLHAKHALLLVEDPPDAADPDAVGSRRLIVVTTSANLTRTGWWENVEVAQVHSIEAGARDSLRDDLLGPGGLVARLRGLSAGGMGHHAIDAIRDFLRQETRPYQHSRVNGVLLPRMWTGSGTLSSFITSELALACRHCELEIISPFFEDTAEASTLRAFLAELGPRRTRIFLPRDTENRVLCSREYYEAVEGMPSVEWAELPPALLQYGRGGERVRRFVHAKIYRLFSPKEKWDFLIIGSPNLTSAAHRGARSGNLETAVFVDASGKKRPEAWMTPVEELVGPEFLPQRSEDDLEGPPFLPITFRFDWRTLSLSYFFEIRRDDPPAMVAVHGIGGGHLCDLSPPLRGEWHSLPEDVGMRAADLLKAGAFLELRIEGELPQIALVHEEEMALRPSLLLSLSAEEILEYWSLLTPEQRDGFLETRLAMLIGSNDEARRLFGEDELPGIFDRFAGIFHAFSCLRECLDDALSSKTRSGEKDAVYRLFGRKHDTLRSLLQKLIEDDEGDPVNRYFGYLCCREIVNWTCGKHHAFAKKFENEMAELKARLAEGERLRASLTLGSDEDGEKFLHWLEEMFFQPVVVPGGGRAA